MQRSKCSLAAVAALALVALATPQAPVVAAQAEAGWIDVLSVRVDANGLIIIVCRGIGDVQVADGTYRGPGGGVVFKDGTIVSVTGRDSYGVEEVTIGDEDEIILLSAETATAKPSPHILTDGEYRSRGGLGRDHTRKTLAIGFRIRSGAIVSALARLS